MFKNNFQKGFTLAEVLITLTIVGVIAALTIPNLLHKHYQKEMEVRFQKAYSITANVLSLIVSETGTDLYSQYGSSNEKKAEFIELFNSKLNPYKMTNDTITYFCSYTNDCSDWSISGKAYLKNDMIFYYRFPWADFAIMADINGQKGPNRLGHDIFVFDIKTGKIQTPTNYGSLCTKTTTKNVYNGFGCLQYALQNRCPDNSTKTYWECLSK